MNLPKNIPIYGDTKYRNKKCPTESQEQMTFFNVLKLKHPTLGSIAFHQRNEGKRSYKQAAYHKAEGMTVGVPDIIIPGKITFLCELKRQDHTLCKIDDKQISYLDNCIKQGAFACIALGYESAILAVDDYLKVVKFIYPKDYFKTIK